jgi:PAS domain S-box-containing protein
MLTAAAEIAAIYEAAPIGIVLFDRDFRFLRINRRMAEINNLAAEDHIGRVIEEILPLETCTALRAMQPKLLAGEEIGAIEIAGTDLVSGQLRHWRISYKPLRDDDGELAGFLGTIDDITSLKQTELQLQRQNSTYRMLIENNPFGVYLIDGDFRMASASRGTRRVFSKIVPLIGRDFAEIVRLVWTPEFAADVIDRFRHTLATGEPYAAATTEQRGDADAVESYDWCLERIPLPDGGHGVVCYFYDLTERRAYEDRVGLLMREVDHRARNLLAVVGAVARYTVATNPNDFLGRFEARVQALAAGQELLVGSQWTNIPIDRLVRTHLSHLDDLIGRRIRLDGPEVRVNPAAAQALGMAVHELATNATKYGALSNGSGAVDVRWALTGDAFRIAWLEAGGPPVQPPERRGFGSTVVGAMVKSALGGQVELDFAPEGLRWQCEAPAARLIAEAATMTGLRENS